MKKPKIKIQEESKMLYYDKGEFIKGIDSELANNESNDCSVRCLASATGVTYEEAYEYCKKYFKREDRDGAEGFIKTLDIREGLPFLGNCTYKRFGKYCFHNRISIKDFVDKHYFGTYMICIENHVFTISNGIIVGNIEDSIKVDREIIYVYKIIKNGKD